MYKGGLGSDCYKINAKYYRDDHSDSKCMQYHKQLNNYILMHKTRDFFFFLLCNAKIKFYLLMLCVPHVSTHF